MQGGALSPQMLQNMQGGDMDAYRKHLDQFGITPDDVMKKILSDPELAQVAATLCCAVLFGVVYCCMICYALLCTVTWLCCAVLHDDMLCHLVPT